MAYIYINARPKRWRITSSYRALKAMERLAEIRDLGYSGPTGVHEGVGVRINFVLNLTFASQEDKDAYESNPSYAYFLRKVKRYSKRKGFKLLAE